MKRNYETRKKQIKIRFRFFSLHLHDFAFPTNLILIARDRTYTPKPSLNFVTLLQALWNNNFAFNEQIYNFMLYERNN